MLLFLRDQELDERNDTSGKLNAIYRQDFHADPVDIVGLLCLNKALEGGELDVVSGHHLWDCLQEERPDVIETLMKPIWYSIERVRRVKARRTSSEQVSSTWKRVTKLESMESR